jgi:hypothetical protein
MKPKTAAEPVGRRTHLPELSGPPWPSPELQLAQLEAENHTLRQWAAVLVLKIADLVGRVGRAS